MLVNWSNIAMKQILGIILSAAGILVSGCSTLHKSDSAALQGAWNGRVTGGGGEGACSLTITGKTVDFRGPDADDWCKGTFTLREDTNPKQLIGVITDCPDASVIGKTVNAIYRLEGGTLELTGSPPGDPAL